MKHLKDTLKTIILQFSFSEKLAALERWGLAKEQTKFQHQELDGYEQARLWSQSGWL